MSGASKRLFSAELKMKQRIAEKSGAAPAGVGFDPSGVSNEDLLTAIKALQSEVLMRVAYAKDQESTGTKPKKEERHDPQAELDEASKVFAKLEPASAE